MWETMEAGQKRRYANKDLDQDEGLGTNLRLISGHKINVCKNACKLPA
jgi:hypothetical protein